MCTDPNEDGWLADDVVIGRWQNPGIGSRLKGNNIDQGNTITHYGQKVLRARSKWDASTAPKASNSTVLV